MRLKSLALQGFKSFPEETIIEFHPGITAIVGPNGSGKSNVTDAIRWVLGEQSVKTLRGGQMEDVIFNGTEQRRPMSFCEVSMTLDNADGGLPIEYAEVEITRRLFRSGESEYMINRKNCRLKDINTLFMDTGLGRDGYSIIGQGQIDSILSSKSEDRRRIFEEAAGIQKYKTRRDEALRKHEHTEQNLTRVTDLLNEVEAQLGPLEKQAIKAERWLELSAELKRIDVANTLNRIEINERHLLQIGERVKRLNRDKMRCEQELVQNEERQKQLRAELSTLDQSLTEHRELRALKRERRAELTSTIEVSRERHRQLTERHQRDDAVRLETEQRQAKLRADIEEQKNQVEVAQAEWTKSKSALDEKNRLKTEQVDKSEKLSDQLSQLSEHRTALASQRDEYDRELIRLRTRLELQQHQIKSGQDEVATAKQLLATAEAQALQENEAVAEAERKAQSFRQEIDVVVAKSEKIKDQAAVAREALNKSEQALRDQAYRLRTLQELEDNLAGYSETVKILLKQIKNVPELNSQVLGTIGSLLDVPALYEEAIETALGSAVQNIVVTDEKVAGALIERLKTQRLGRATFLPLATMQGRRIKEDDRRLVESIKGFLGTAADLISYDQQLEGIILQLLGRVLVVEDLDTGILVARKMKHRYRVVTLEGEIFNVGGSMTGGYRKHKSSGLLGRNREISELKALMPRLNNTILRNKDELEKIECNLHDMQKEVEHIKEQATAHSEKLIVARTEAKRASDLVTEQKQIFTNRTQTLKSSKAAQIDIETQITNNSEKIREINGKISTITDQINILETQIDDQSGKLESINNVIQGLYIEAEGRRQQCAAAEHMLERLQGDLNEADRLIARYESSTEDLRETIAENENKRKQASVDLDAVAAELVEIVKQIETVEIARRTSEELLNETLQVERKLREQATVTAGEFVRNENTLQQLESSLNRDKNNLWENYELTHLSADEWRDSEIDSKQAERDIKTLRQKIRGLGHVNVNAVEDFARLSERHRFMTEQQNDILKSQKDLLAVIRELTFAMREQFSANLKQINENFGLIFAELFGGGKGEIILENSDDVLMADIQIRVSPPGKKLQNMLLLSGGERCLTAIALLFSFLKLRPSPFCIMDEVEAALDESNIFRFTNFIQKYSDNSQFVIITHRKGTMEAAARIYGVAMPERGISKILSLQLTDA